MKPPLKQIGAETSAGHCFDESCLCIASLPEYQHQSGAARLHIHPQSAHTQPALTYTGQEEDRGPNMCPARLLVLSHVRLGAFSQQKGGGNEEIHLLTDSAILDFC